MAPRARGAAGAEAALALLMFALARPLVRNPLWAAAPSLFLLLALDDAPERWEPHPGWLSTLLRPPRRLVPGLPAASSRWLVCSGLAAGASYLFKQNTGVFILGALVIRGGLLARRPVARSTPMAGAAADRAARGSVRPGHAGVAHAAAGRPARPGGLLTGFVGAVNQTGLFSPPDLHHHRTPGLPGRRVWLRRARRSRRSDRAAASSALVPPGRHGPLLHPVPAHGHAAPGLVGPAAAGGRRRRPRTRLATAGRRPCRRRPHRPGLADRPGSPGHRLNSPPHVPMPPTSASQPASRPRAPTADDLHGIVADIQHRTPARRTDLRLPDLAVALRARRTAQPDPVRPPQPGRRRSPRQIASTSSPTLDASHVKLVVISDFWEAVWGDPRPERAARSLARLATSSRSRAMARIACSRRDL